MTGTKNNIFRPLAWQIAPWRDKSFIMLLDGSAGGGKSHLAANKIDGFARKYPGATGLIIRKTRESMTNSTLLFYNTQVIAGDPSVQWKKQDKRFEYANGSIVAYGGMKDATQRESIRSIGQTGGLDIVWVEEATQLLLADLEELIPRMRGTAAPWVQIILTVNPDSSEHWIYKRLILGKEATRYRSRASDNEHNPDNYAEEVLGKLTGVRRKRLKDGLWVRTEGAVFETFDPDIHIIDEMPKGWKSWRKFRAIDFGFVNPFVCQWWAMDGDGRLYMYREIYFSERIVSDHAVEMFRLEAGLSRENIKEMRYEAETEDVFLYNLRKLAEKREKIDFTVADHDREDRETLKKAGIRTQNAKKSISDGIEHVQLRLRVQKDDRARLFFLQGALSEVDRKLVDQHLPISTVQEFPEYSYHDSADGKPNKEDPIDLNNHGVDTARYMVMAIDGGQSRKVKQHKENPFFS